MVFHHLQEQDLNKSGFRRKYQNHIKPVQKVTKNSANILGMINLLTYFMSLISLDTRWGYQKRTVAQNGLNIKEF